MDSRAAEQEAEAAEPAEAEEACLRVFVARVRMRACYVCGAVFPGIDWVVQEAVGTSRRRRRKKSLGMQIIQM